ncbi:3-isopropylmalate dehydrogenase [Nitrospira japonica]|uniref:3-isopropylmalate dehydrogenase n=1 Tax=Nitrospira japonica TaxID=1325564 RepID=A0A1W1I5I5_9BACT|nr:3-isopropylmalate dehydrogenase [Nitrospira japonica]SLM48191.1 3-isopropylmalate dehydrogenase [Nitrospira japonica]
MKAKIAVLAGDGVGREIVPEAVKVLKVVAEKFGHTFDFAYGDVGGQAIDKVGVPLPQDTLALAKQSDAVLLGAVGGPKWEGLEYSLRPERALLGLREQLGLFANLRPAKLYEVLADASTLKKEVIEGIDILVIRELTGGIYFGKPKGIEALPNGGERGVNTEVYTTEEIRRIAKVAFEAARRRRKKVTSVDKANVLESSELWRRVVIAVQKDFPDVELNHIYVDNAAMQLVRNPRQFDVMLCNNIFGDILSDEAAMLTGSIGMLPSASIGAQVGLFEPIHGSAPDIAGKNIANPIATIASAAMLLSYAFKLDREAHAIEEAIVKTLDLGYRTKDIHSAGSRLVGTTDMGEAVVRNLK